MKDLRIYTVEIFAKNYEGRQVSEVFQMAGVSPEEVIAQAKRLYSKENPDATEVEGFLFDESDIDPNNDFAPYTSPSEEVKSIRSLTKEKMYMNVISGDVQSIEDDAMYTNAVSGHTQSGKDCKDDFFCETIGDLLAFAHAHAHAHADDEGDEGWSKLTISDLWKAWSHDSLVEEGDEEREIIQ